MSGIEWAENRLVNTETGQVIGVVREDEQCGFYFKDLRHSGAYAQLAAAQFAQQQGQAAYGSKYFLTAKQAQVDAMRNFK